MPSKEIKLIGIPEIICVNEDGTEIHYKGKKVRTYLVKNKNQRNGFMQCAIAGKRLYVHHIVAEAFVPNIRPIIYKIIMHKDFNSLNNHYTNLEWGTNKILYQNLAKLGIVRQKNELMYRGTSKISYNEALKIAKRLDNGETALNISNEYGVSQTSIWRIRKRYCERKEVSPRYSKQIKDTVLKLCQTHKPANVAKIVGIRYETIWKWMNRYKQRLNKL